MYKHTYTVLACRALCLSMILACGRVISGEILSGHSAFTLVLLSDQISETARNWLIILSDATR